MNKFEDMKQLSTTAKNALINARRAKECKNYKEARSYYRIVLMEDPENWEAFFYNTYCEAIEEKNFSRGAEIIVNCMDLVLKDIKKLEDVAEQFEAIKRIFIDLIFYFWLVINTYKRKKTNISQDPDIGLMKRIDVLAKFDNLYACYFSSLTAMLKIFGDKVVSKIGKNEFTNLIKIKCYETIFEAFPSELNADELKNVNPSSPALIEYESKSSWEKRDETSKFAIGCGIFLIAFFIFGLIMEQLAKDPNECPQRY